MKKIVLRRTNTNIILCCILFAAIFAIVAYPVGIYLLDIGLRPLYSYVVGIVLGHLVAWTALILTVRFEPKGRPKPSFECT